MRRDVLWSLVAAASLAVAAGACKKDDKSGKSAGKGAAKAAKGAKQEPPAPAPLTAEQKVQKIKACWAAYDAGDDAKLASCYADNATSEYVSAIPPRSATGSKAIVAMHAENRVAFPDLKHEIVLILVSGNQMVVVAGSSGTNTGPLMGQPATNKKMGVLNAQYLAVNDQGLVEREEFFVDSAAIMGQLGPGPAKDNPVYEMGSLGETRVLIAADDDEEKANLELVKKYVSLVNEHKAADVAALCSDGMVLRESPGTPETFDAKALRKLLEAQFSAIPDMHAELAWSFAAGDFVAYRTDFRGTHTGFWDAFGIKAKPTGNTIELGQLDVERLEDGLFVENWMFANNLKMLVALGIVPDPTQALPKKDGDKAPGADKKPAGKKPAN